VNARASLVSPAIIYRLWMLLGLTPTERTRRKRHNQT